MAEGVKDTTEVNNKRLRTVLIGTGAAYTVGLIALNEVWYKDQGKTDFHFTEMRGVMDQIELRRD